MQIVKTLKRIEALKRGYRRAAEFTHRHPDELTGIEFKLVDRARALESTLEAWELEPVAWTDRLNRHRQIRLARKLLATQSLRSL